MTSEAHNTSILNRRELLVQASGVVVTTSLLVSCGGAATPATASQDSVNGGEEGSFQLPPLGYEYNALEPYIDEQTMHLHHDKHHAAYVTNLNAALKDPAFTSLTIDEVLLRLNELPEDIRATVRNNGGGHANHTMFWELMRPGGDKQPTGTLAGALEESFGSFDEFKTGFNEAGTKQFGSGWAWLVLDEQGTLKIHATANQDSPLLEGYYPIMGNDVWEHAYYLKYHNVRADYLAAWWNVVNWSEVEKRYTSAQQFFQK